ncbi:nuclease-related domain-containing protein [Pseudogracilibacillus auburnensis]|uniref:nuclease-related domain-containing protein n=1 Tax=Pseudogracilibacillus auburnensis TaxID=1494959 RepID=UPI001A95C024|nr:nuclease-related domain-containing protein [Pseudogracilibacillus auburnensis]MBO1003963.1 NERD domain-containing protein [Pseudogracilibacillus auburnensis]
MELTIPLAHSKPQPSKELIIFNHLYPRMNFSANEKLTYDNLKKGFIGEEKFYHILKKTLDPYQLVLFNLLLESNNTEFQIDNTIIIQNTIFLFEVKNFEGDYYFEGNKWYIVSSRKEIRNPLLQLQRTEFLFKQILQKLNVNFDVKSYIIFINEEFTLYQSPLGLPIIFPTQLNRFIKDLNSQPQKLTAHHTKLAKQLMEIHIEESRHSRLPKYEYNQLKKGIVCRFCPGFMSYLSYKKLVCNKCGEEEEIASSVMRSVAEFNLLFPEIKITTRAIHEWCVVVESKKTIRKILLKHLTFIQHGKYSYYAFTTTNSQHV